MKKYWHPSWAAPERAYLLNEDIWFKQNQELLLLVANTKNGREILAIPQEYPEIIHIRKNCVHALHSYNRVSGKASIVADFRIGAKFANSIRSNWHAFNSLSRSFLNGKIDVPVSTMARAKLSMVALTLTAFPDPHSETSTCDGRCYRDGGTETFTTKRAGNGTGFDDSADPTYINGVNEDAGSGNFSSLQRGIFLFDTSSLSASASISSASFGLVCNQTLTTGGDVSYGITSATTASNTALAASDFQSNTSGTRWATDIAEGSIATDDSTYNTWTLNATGLAGISKTGITKIACKNSADIDNSALTWIDGSSQIAMRVRMADQALTTKDPKFIVNYTVVTFVPKIIFH